MTEFEIHCFYALTNKRKFFNDQAPQEYHKFQVINQETIPLECLNQKEKNCWLWIADYLVKNAKINFEAGNYCFIMTLKKEKAAKFKVKDHRGDNSMVLKTPEYWENTVKKIGFWGSEDYFYEVNKKPKGPPQRQDNNNQPENKNFWVKVAWICLPVLFFFICLALLVKWINKKQK